jgi:hypothetical protein
MVHLAYSGYHLSDSSFSRQENGMVQYYHSCVGPRGLDEVAPCPEPPRRSAHVSSREPFIKGNALGAHGLDECGPVGAESRFIELKPQLVVARNITGPKVRQRRQTGDVVQTGQQLSHTPTPHGISLVQKG